MTDIASIPASMLFWLASMMIALAGTMVYIEFGLAIPRLHEESVPRNGGEKNYVKSNTRWSTISNENLWISISCAVIFTLGNAYPLAAIWVPPSRSDTVSTSVSFWVTGTVGLATLAFGALN